MFRKSRIIGALFILPMLLVSMAGVRSVAAAPAAQPGAQTWTVMVGQAIATMPGDKANWQALKFYSDNITINAGDTITWNFNAGPEPHNVVFLGRDNKIPESPLIEPPAGGQGPPRIVENPLIANRQGGNTYDGTTFTNSGII